MIKLNFNNLLSLLKVFSLYCLFQITCYYYFGCSVISVVECSGINPEDVTTNLYSKIESSNTTVESSNTAAELSNEPNKAVSQDGEASTKNYNFNINSDALTVIGEAAKATGKALESYTPVVTGTAVSLGTAANLKTLPPKERAGALISAGMMIGGTALMSQWLKTTVSNNDNKSEADSIISEIDKLDSKPNLNEDLNRSLTKSPDMDPNSFINSPLEEFTDLDMIVISIIIVNLGALLMMCLIIINFAIKLFKFESREFVTSRPRLHRFVTLSLKSRDYYTFFILLMVLFGLCSIFYGLSHLLHIIRVINI